MKNITPHQTIELRDIGVGVCRTSGTYIAALLQLEGNNGDKCMVLADVIRQLGIPDDLLRACLKDWDDWENNVDPEQDEQALPEASPHIDARTAHHPWRAAELIEHAHQVAGLQAELAARCGVTPEKIRRTANGQLTMSYALQVTLEAIIREGR